MGKRWDEMTDAEKAAEDERRIDADWLRKFGYTRAEWCMVQDLNLSPDDEQVAELALSLSCGTDEDLKKVVADVIKVVRLVEQGKLTVKKDG